MKHSFSNGPLPHSLISLLLFEAVAVAAVLVVGLVLFVLARTDRLTYPTR